MLQYGALSSHRQTDPQKLVIPVFSPKSINSTATVRGWWLTRWVDTRPLPHVRDVVTQILSLVAKRKLRPPPVTVYPLTKIEDVLRATENGRPGGKAVLQFS